jgi:hypothetical protein
MAVMRRERSRAGHGAAAADRIDTGLQGHVVEVVNSCKPCQRDAIRGRTGRANRKKPVIDYRVLWIESQ